ncbi:hypothetical protein GCM10027184_17010 [Saccharothrix stipae]
MASTYRAQGRLYKVVGRFDSAANYLTRADTLLGKPPHTNKSANEPQRTGGSTAHSPCSSAPTTTPPNRYATSAPNSKPQTDRP